MEKRKLVTINPHSQIDLDLNWFEIWMFKRIWKRIKYKVQKNPKLRGYKVYQLVVDEF